MNCANTTLLENHSDQTTTLKSLVTVKSHNGFWCQYTQKFDGELHLYASNNVIPQIKVLREIPLCVLKNNFVAEVKDL